MYFKKILIHINNNNNFRDTQFKCQLNKVRHELSNYQWKLQIEVIVLKQSCHIRE